MPSWAEGAEVDSVTPVKGERLNVNVTQYFDSCGILFVAVVLTNLEGEEEECTPCERCFPGKDRKEWKQVKTEPTLQSSRLDVLRFFGAESLSCPSQRS